MGGGHPVGAEPTERADAVPISGTRAARYQVVLHVDAATLSEDSAGPAADAGGSGRSELEDGTRVAAETSRRISCDAGLVRITHAPDGSVLDVGRRTRTIPPALRRALEARDRGCRFPGCGLRFTDAHHLKHWADGGETGLTNTALLCNLSRIRDNRHYPDSRIIRSGRRASLRQLERSRDNHRSLRKRRSWSSAWKRR